MKHFKLFEEFKFNENLASAEKDYWSISIYRGQRDTWFKYSVRYRYTKDYSKGMSLCIFGSTFYIEENGKLNRFDDEMRKKKVPAATKKFFWKDYSNKHRGSLKGSEFGF